MELKATTFGGGGNLLATYKHAAKEVDWNLTKNKCRQWLDWNANP